MPPKGRGGRAGSAMSAASGRTSSRLAAKQEEAAQEREAAEAFTNAPAPPPDSSMPPPPPPSTRGRGRGRSARGAAESYARRGTTRGSRGGSSIASFGRATRDTPFTSDVYGADDEDPFPPQSGTPQSVDAANRVYGSSPSEAAELTPRTRDATANLMNKFVDRLFSVSKDLMSHLAIDATDRDESWVDELHTHKVVFNTFYKIYTDKDAEAFIDIDAVSQRTKVSDNVILWQRMIKTVATANLANLLSDVEDLDSDHSYVLNRLPLVQRIDDVFPEVFIPGGRQGLDGQDWLMDSETVEQAFTVRTHRFIETLRVVEQANPFRLFARVFLDLDVDSMTDEMLEQRISGADYKPFVGFDIMGPDAQAFRDKIAGFQNLLTQMETTAIIDQLEAEYPFDSFLKSMKDWIRVFEAKVPGPPRPVAHSIYNGDSPYSPGAQLQAEANSSRFTVSAVKALQRFASASAQQAQGGEGSDFMDDGESFQAFDDDASLAGTDAQVLNRARSQANQGPFFTPGSDGSLYAAAAADMTNRAGGRKRGRKNTDDANANAKRAREAAAVPLPDATLDAHPTPSIPFDPVALSQASQLISKANRRPAVPKARRPWTAHDTQQLVAAVHVYKAKWSTIEKAIKGHHIPFNVIERDQQGLRDKARLVKVDILKTDLPLPPSFDLVVLGRKEKDMVIATGRNPDRREADTDANGDPINTLYDPNAPPPPPLQVAMQQAPEVAAEEVEQSEANDLRPLQEEAQMAMNTHMGGSAPDAPMMTADMGAPTQVSESLGEGMSVAPEEAPIDPNISQAGPSSEVAPV
ncbi:hypothetical protein N0V93_009117 [Gnomoniopsis smithogilvyi]|uniref:HTH myb-type domain-containing protein n=1 Tax=Gnomoniopsis smithogilvyi TaxID=1191159 RepID=A0A9W8YJ30_9PEZI|nr:hypothetical protein N0V93_009117 [Gnomoniopsis smithogilvyi]